MFESLVHRLANHENTMKASALILLPLAFTLAACGPAPSDQTTPVAETAAPAAAPVPQVVVAPTKMIHAEPAALAVCKPGAVVTLKWDVRKEKPELTTVKIYTESGKLFTHSGASGSQATGNWVKPGSVFVLKSGVDDTELERLTIGGPVCP
ncbi:hypothetical protein [Thermomonas carbonis]|uniref:Uncharacterized protein n=1 Tax=Thermomonas carbonis TaxID=1463158 RepID=A0A7G9SU80_9GAMM|nr:hypothetical protein [Thermomonas carbonis]QNN71405.1 hypothetical protein H9L16_07650 [Thermomonas carbonis]